MRILYIVNTYPDENNPSAEPFVKAQIESMRRAGAYVDIFNVKGPQSKWNYLRAIARVRRKLKNKSYDIVHGHYVYSGWIAALQKKAPAVVSFMGSDLYGTSDQDGKLTFGGKVDIRLSKFVQHYVDGIIVKSQEMMDLLITRDKAIVLPNGVDFETFMDSPTLEARKALGLSPDKCFILFAGNYQEPRKCFFIADEGVRIAKERDHRYEILVAAGLPQEQVPLYMNAANVLALPSRKEGSPNVVKEALACNLKVVATDVGDVKELIGNIPGCKVVERTSEAFADAIQEVISRTEPFNGRKAIEHLRIEQVARKLMNFYSLVMEN